MCVIWPFNYNQESFTDPSVIFVCAKVLWLPADQRDLVQELDPELQQTSGSRASIEELQENNIIRLNLHYSSMSQEQIRYQHLLY